MLVWFLDKKPVINSLLGYILSSHAFQFVPKQGTTMSYFLITFFFTLLGFSFFLFFFFLKLKIPLVLMTQPYDALALCVYYAANTERACILFTSTDFYYTSNIVQFVGLLTNSSPMMLLIHALFLELSISSGMLMSVTCSLRAERVCGSGN